MLKHEPFGASSAVPPMSSISRSRLLFGPLSVRGWSSSTSKIVPEGVKRKGHAIGLQAPISMQNTCALKKVTFLFFLSCSRMNNDKYSKYNKMRSIKIAKIALRAVNGLGDPLTVRRGLICSGVAVKSSPSQDYLSSCECSSCCTSIRLTSAR